MTARKTAVVLGVLVVCVYLRWAVRPVVAAYRIGAATGRMR